MDLATREQKVCLPWPSTAHSQGFGCLGWVQPWIWFLLPRATMSLVAMATHDQSWATRYFSCFNITWSWKIFFIVAIYTGSVFLLKNKEDLSNIFFKFKQSSIVVVANIICKKEVIYNSSLNFSPLISFFSQLGWEDLRKPLHII